MEPKTELQRNAIDNARRRDLETYQRALDMDWLNSRMEDGRMSRCLTLIKREAEMEKDWQDRSDHAAIVNARSEKEIALAREVAKVQSEEACQLLRRHQLRERDPELRRLITKLQAGYVCRDLRQQILHNEFKRWQDKAKDMRTNAVLRDALYSDREMREEEDRRKMEQNNKYCHELHQQIVNRQRQNQCEYEESLIEKKMIEDVMRTIADEDHRELEQKREAAAKLQREMVSTQRAKEHWKQTQKQMLVQEERDIEEQRRQLSDRNAAIVAERLRRQQVKEAICEKICDQIMADEAERKERTDIIKQLQEQEALETDINKDLGEREKGDRIKRETLHALMEQMNHRKHLAEEQRLRDLDLRKKTAVKVAADDEKERQNELKKKDKKRQYARELLRQIEEDARRKKNDKEEEEARTTSVWEYQKSWDNEVLEERKKIVTEHAPHLIGYLEAGVVTPSDLPSIREGADRHERLKTLDIEGMGRDHQRPKIHPKCTAQCRVIREY